MRKTGKLKVMFRGQTVGTLSLTPDNHLNVFEYDKSWLADGFSISPLELPLKPGVFIAKPQPFYGNFGIFEPLSSSQGIAAKRGQRFRFVIIGPARNCRRQRHGRTHLFPFN